MAIPPIKYTARLHVTIRAAAIAIDSVNSNGVVSPDNLQALANPLILAFDDSDAAQTASDNLAARTTADNLIDADKSAQLKALRGAAAVLVDEINNVRQWLVSFKAQVAAATTLADLKIRVATLPDMPDRSLAQAKTAIKAKIDAGLVD